MQNDIGTAEAGNYANIIAVQGNPLADISVMQKIGFVVKGGGGFGPAEEPPEYQLPSRPVVRPRNDATERQRKCQARAPVLEIYQFLGKHYLKIIAALRAGAWHPSSDRGSVSAPAAGTP